MHGWIQNTSAFIFWTPQHFNFCQQQQQKSRCTLLNSIKFPFIVITKPRISVSWMWTICICSFKKVNIFFALYNTWTYPTLLIAILQNTRLLFKDLHWKCNVLKKLAHNSFWAHLYELKYLSWVISNVQYNKYFSFSKGIKRHRPITHAKSFSAHFIQKTKFSAYYYITLFFHSCGKLIFATQGTL